MQDLLTVREAAEHLGVSRMSVRRLIAAGRLAAQRHGRAFAIRRADLARIVWPKRGRPRRKPLHL